MHARREDPSKPAWSSDRLDSPHGPEIEAPYFDADLGAWVFSRYADILAALRSSSLIPANPDNPNNPGALSESARLKMRADTLGALSPTQLRAWREQLKPEASRLIETLPLEQPVDLVTEYARPLCLALAAIVTGISIEEARNLYEPARHVSAAAAEPYDPALRVAALSATTQMQSCFHAEQATLRDSGFVALSQTMPCILGNAWFALLQYPQEWRLLHQQPSLMDQAIEELLRYAGPVRILFRQAIEDFDLNGSHIQKGDRLVLRLIAANHDPEHFPYPNQLDIERPTPGQLALGAGPHACVAANLIRMVAATITHPLLERFSEANLTQPIQWQGGSGFRAPAALWVRLSGV